MILYNDVKVTPTELAKLIIQDKGAVGKEYWHEDTSIDREKMTAREEALLDEALDKQLNRVRKFLGWFPIADRVYEWV